MTSTQKIGLLGTINMLLSILYLILFFLFGSHDFGHFSHKNASLTCVLYGLLLFFIGVCMTYFAVGKDDLHETMKDLTYSSRQESILDDLQHQDEKKRNKFDINSILAINILHLSCSLFFAIGQYILGFCYAVVVVFAFVYAIVWLLLGVSMFWPMYRNQSF